LQVAVAASVSLTSAAFAAASSIHCHLGATILLRSLAGHLHPEFDLHLLGPHFTPPSFWRLLDRQLIDHHLVQAQQLVG